MARSSNRFCDVSIAQADLEALRTAGEKMQELIVAAGTSEDEIVADFRKLRRKRRTSRTRP